MTLASTIRSALVRSPAGGKRFLDLILNRPDGNPYGVRVAWVRMESIRKALASGNPFNANTLSRSIGCCRKTISRDIRALKSSGMSVRYDPVANTFKLDRKNQQP